MLYYIILYHNTGSGAGPSRPEGAAPAETGARRCHRCSNTLIIIITTIIITTIIIAIIITTIDIATISTVSQ